MRPAAYKYWNKASRDYFDERVAIMLEGNRLPMDGPVPDEITIVATREAEANERLIHCSEVQLPLLR